MKFLKVMFGATSGADSSLEYRIGEVNVADNWNPNADDPKEMEAYGVLRTNKIVISSFSCRND